MSKKKSPKDLRKELVELFSAAVIEASKAYGKDPHLVTQAEYNEFSDLSEWELRKMGGFNSLKKATFPLDDQNFSSIRESARMKNYVAKLERDLGDKQMLENEIKQAIIGNIKPVKVESYKAAKSKSKFVRHNVAMINDAHIGLKVDSREVAGLNEFNFEIASRRIAFYIDEVCKYKVDKRDEVEVLHLLINGDIITGIIHGLQGRDLEMLTHQFNGAVHILTNAITPLAQCYKKVNVYFSTGNHGDAPHRREGGRVLSQIYDSFEGQIFYAISVAHKNTKNVEFFAGHTLHQDFFLPAGRAAFTHGHLMFSSALGNPGTTVNTKSLGTAIADFNTGERRQGKEEVKLFMFGHTHCHFHITTKDGVQVYNAPSLSGIDSFALSIGVRHNLTGQVIFESTEDYIVGDIRLIHVSEADKNKEYDKIIKPYKHELVYSK